MPSETGQWSRDEEYYFPGGDVIVLVSSLLFKVHRHILARDGSSFENMFALDAVAGNVTNNSNDNHISIFQQDGSSDETPIQLQGDTADDFRHFLWCLYALPQDIAQLMSPLADTSDVTNISKLISVLGMAHKYHFVSTEDWATRTISEHLQDMSPGYLRLPIPALIKISEVAVVSRDTSLLDVVRKRWRRLIAENQHLGLALTTTERLGLHSLQGLAYQALLLKGRAFWDKEPELTREHRIRLLSGFHNLTHFCAALPDMPPAFEHHAGCADTRICEETWARIWRAVFSDTAPGSDTVRGDGMGGLEARMQVKHDYLDVARRLMMATSIVKVLLGSPEVSGILEVGFVICSGCKSAAIHAAVGFSRKTQDELIDLFEDVV